MARFPCQSMSTAASPHPGPLPEGEGGRGRAAANPRRLLGKRPKSKRNQRNRPHAGAQRREARCSIRTLSSPRRPGLSARPGRYLKRADLPALRDRRPPSSHSEDRQSPDRQAQTILELPPRNSLGGPPAHRGPLPSAPGRGFRECGSCLRKHSRRDHPLRRRPLASGCAVSGSSGHECLGYRTRRSLRT